MKIAIIRGAYLNKYEMQSYEPLAKKFHLTGFSSLKPLQDNYSFPLIKLASLMDLPDFPYKLPILNRLFGDSHLLFSLENKLQGFDIAHCSETYYYYVQQCLNAKEKGYIKKVISTVWENIPFNNEGIRLRKEFKKRAIREIDHFICVTNQAKSALIKEGCDERKISVIYPGVNLQKFSHSGRQPATFVRDKQINKLTILFVGRLENEKGIWDLLNAFYKLKIACPPSAVAEGNCRRENWKLKIIGNGKEKSKILEKIKKWNLERNIEINEVPYEVMPQVYQDADIFVLASKSTKYWREQFGMVLIEAMASGLPIIGSDSGSIPEVIGDSGIIFKENNQEDLIKKLSLLISNKEIRLNLGKKARIRAETFFDADKQAKKIANIYQK